MCYDDKTREITLSSLLKKEGCKIWYEISLSNPHHNSNCFTNYDDHSVT